MEMGTRDSSPLARTGRRREGRRRLPDAIETGLERRHVPQTSDDWKEEQAGADDRSKLPIGADADPLLDQLARSSVITSAMTENGRRRVR